MDIWYRFHQNNNNNVYVCDCFVFLLNESKPKLIYESCMHIHKCIWIKGKIYHLCSRAGRVNFILFLFFFFYMYKHRFVADFIVFIHLPIFVPNHFKWARPQYMQDLWHSFDALYFVLHNIIILFRFCNILKWEPFGL